MFVEWIHSYVGNSKVLVICSARQRRKGKNVLKHLDTVLEVEHRSLMFIECSIILSAPEVLWFYCRVLEK